MEALFLKCLNLSISAGWLILAVMVLRQALKKAPKWVSCLLWALVGLRLVVPLSPESALSLVPSAQTVPPTIVTDPVPAISSGLLFVNQAVNPLLSGMASSEEAAASPVQRLVSVVAVLWAMGVVLMLAYLLLSYARLYRQTATAVRLRDNVFQSEFVGSPFILGLARPRIYVPYHMEEAALSHVLAHERAHLKRRDHWIKPMAFLVLAVYWFNPLVWAAYVLLCRDIELACDEKVVKNLGEDERKDYSLALLDCAGKRPTVTACPLAFGEVGVKERVARVKRYKKPAFWVSLAALAVCAVVAVCFLTSPPGDHTPYEWTHSTSEKWVSRAQVVCYRSGTVLGHGGSQTTVLEELDREQIGQLLDALRSVPQSAVTQGRGVPYEVSVILDYKGGEYRLGSGGDVVELSFDAKTAERYPTEMGVWQISDAGLAAVIRDLAPEPVRVYRFEGGEFAGTSLTLGEDGTFWFVFSLISSYIGHGSYTVQDDRLALKTDDGQFTYVFDMVDDTLVFDAEASSDVVWFSGLVDGSVMQ